MAVLVAHLERQVLAACTPPAGLIVAAAAMAALRRAWGPGVAATPGQETEGRQAVQDAIW